MSGLTSIDEGSAEQLATFSGKCIDLSGIPKTADDVAQALYRCKFQLSVGPDPTETLPVRLEDKTFPR